MDPELLGFFFPRSVMGTSFAILKYRLGGVKMKMELAAGRAIKEAFFFYKWVSSLLKLTEQYTFL